MELSPYDIYKMYNIGNSTVRRWLKIHKIPIRSRSEAAKISHNKPEFKRRQSEILKIVMSKSEILAKIRGENNPNWKENYEDLHITAKHKRKRKELKEIGVDEPEYCPICDKKPRIKKYMHLINLDHNYLDNLLDWYYICKWCHDLYDFSTGLRKNVNIKKSPNLIKNLLNLKTREERFQLLKKVIHY